MCYINSVWKQLHTLAIIWKLHAYNHRAGILISLLQFCSSLPHETSLNPHQQTFGKTWPLILQPQCPYFILNAVEELHSFVFLPIILTAWNPENWCFKLMACQGNSLVCSIKIERSQRRNKGEKCKHTQISTGTKAKLKINLWTNWSKQECKKKSKILTKNNDHSDLFCEWKFKLLCFLSCYILAGFFGNLSTKLFSSAYSCPKTIISLNQHSQYPSNTHGMTN